MAAGRAWRAVYWIGLALGVLFIAVGVAAGPLHENYFIADHLYIPTLFADLTRWHGRLSDWQLTPAPYVFPDMLLYGAAWLVTGAKTSEPAQYLTCCLQLLLVMVASRALLRRALPARAAETALVVPLLVAWLMLYACDAAALVGPTLIFSAHGGTLLITLVVFALCLRPDHPPRATGTVAVGVLSALTGASDGLFVASSSVALGVTALAAAWWQRRAQPPVLVVRCALAAVCGPAGLWAARQSGIARAENLHGGTSVAFENAARLWQDPDPLAKYALLGLAIVAVFACLLAASERATPRLRILACWQLLTTGSVLSALLYTGAYGDRWTLRYLIVPCELSVVVFAGWLSARLPEDSSAWASRALTTLTLVSIGAFVCSITPLAHGNYQAPQRKAAQCVRRVGEREGVTAVLADYWVAKPLMLFTDDRVHALAVRSYLQPYFWITSRGWYRGPHQFGLLITNGLAVSRARKVLHDPQSIERCEDLELYIYRDAARDQMTRRVRAIFDKALVAFAVQ
ncbi:MAG TPA: hypothetical protein VJV78_33930 [Polyangiales bacterium]|nr:hypothetical protein [Polyangiales bacterium]